MICSHVLQHVRSPEQVIEEAWRVLVPGGRAYFTLLDSYPYHAGGEGYGDYHRFKEDAVGLLLGAWSAVHVLRGGGVGQVAMGYVPHKMKPAAQRVSNAVDRRRVDPHDPDALRVRDEMRTHRDLSKWVRSAGLGVVLDRSVDAGDWICGHANYFPLSATGAGITLRGGLRHHSFLTGLDDDGDDYDRDITNTIQRHLRPGWTFIDGGAHIGYHTIGASRLVGDTGRVLAFEPDPYNVAALRRNVRGLRNVEVRCEALGATPGTATFQRSRGTISSSIVPRGGTDLIDTFDVQVVTIDDVAERDPRVFVKLDLEGLEIEVLEGMHRTAAATEELVVMAETNQTALGSAGKTPLDLIETLESLGLSAYQVRADDRLIPARESELWKGDLIAVRP